MTMQPAPPQQVTPVHGSAHTGGSTDDGVRLVHYIGIAMLICIPLFAAAWVGLIALAVTIAGVGYAAPLLMAIAVGVLAGVFFGAWIGFVLYSREVD